MPRTVNPWLVCGWSWCLVGLVSTVHVQARTPPALTQQFQCPARVQAQSAEFDAPGDMAGFSHRFPTQAAARLLRVSIQYRQADQVADLPPQVSRERRLWEIPLETQSPSTVTFWCHYEAGIALARPVRPGIRQCEAEFSGSARGARDIGERPSAELGRVSVACQ